MEIKLNKIESSDYYNEVLAVMSNYKKLVENPRQKIRGLKTQATILTIISLVFLAVFSILYIQDKSNSMYLVVIAIFAIALIAGIVYIFLINRRVSQFKNNDADRTLCIEDDYVELTMGNEKSRLEMSEIQYILINKHSICFLPRQANSTMIAVHISYKNQVLEAISNKNLIVDNSNLYQ